MRKKILVANWKMNLNREDSVNLSKEIISSIKDDNSIDIVFAPSFVDLYKINKMCNDKDYIHTSSQDCSKESIGAFTGEVSASMIQSLGVKYVIIGHSERRDIFLESNNDIKLKVSNALENNLSVIFCCGESLIHRKKGKHFEFIESQINDSLFNLNKQQFNNITIAYEPIWAIGTGMSASPEQAEEMHIFIREKIKNKYGDDMGNNTSILYGGSCNPKNAKELFLQDNIDGGLIGGASLKADSFIDLLKSF